MKRLIQVFQGEGKNKPHKKRNNKSKRSSPNRTKTNNPNTNRTHGYLHRTYILPSYFLTTPTHTNINQDFAGFLFHPDQPHNVLNYRSVYFENPNQSKRTKT